MASDPDRARLKAAFPGHRPHELFPCGPALADTAAYCEAYDFSPSDAANTIIVAGKASPPRHVAAWSSPRTGST